MAQNIGGIMGDLKNFLNGVTGLQISRSRNDADYFDLVKTATSLLRHLPAAREAVLYFFCQVVDESITKHLSLPAGDAAAAKKRTTDSRDVVPIIYDVLSSLIKCNPKGWAPVISTWSLRLLGQMSTYHSSQLQLNRSDVGLNSTLQVWLSCPATRMLIDLTTQCLEGLTQSETDACINALLETSVEHSPHFDWVVAHIGGCFPQTVVTRVLSCGLQDFVLPGNEAGNISPKLHSVVGILAHLSGSHTTNIQKAVSDLFKWGTSDETAQHVAVVPYLLQLSTLSPDLLDIIIGEIVKCTNDKAVDTLRKHSSLWINKYFANKETMMDLAVQQFIRCRVGSLDLLKTLLTYGMHPDRTISQVSCELFELLLTEASQIVQNAGRLSPAEIPFLQSLHPHVSTICSTLLASDSWQQVAVLRILTLMALLQGPAISNHVVTLLLQKSDSIKVVPLTQRYLQSVRGLHTQVVATSVHEVLKLQGVDLEHALENLLQLVALEKESPKRNFKFQIALNSNLHLFPALFFQDGQVPSLAVKLLNSFRLQELIHPRLVAKLAYSLVPHFFGVLSLRDEAKDQVQSILSTMSMYPNGQALILRLLMQGAFSEEWKYLFSAKMPKRRCQPQVSLLEQNRNFCSSVTLPQRHSSVFHAGIIGNGIRNRPDPQSENDGLDSEDIRNNINYLLDTLSQCCSSNANGMTQLSLLLVEIVSPDVMFNGLPWPDEEFTKVTVERDLHVRRFVEGHVVVWDLLSLLAQNRPALCYCSVLIRALLAILLSHWANCQDKVVQSSNGSLHMTCRLLELMATGQLLPPPLSYLPEILHHLSPHEVHVLLKDVWAFMRDNVPAPSLFVDSSWRDWSMFKMDARYTERLRLIMLANIANVGHLYPRFLGPGHE